MKDKICLVTGASSGIGRATALGLANRGATLVMVCRDAAKGEAARAEIIENSGNEAVVLLIADLASQESIRRLAADFATAHDQLHVLVNNAGTYLTRRQVTGDGIEMTFAVNYLARFLLTNLLMDTLRRGAPSRIVDVAGAYHKKGTLAFDDLQSERSYDGAEANAQAKLANVLFTYELARRLEGTGVTANCLHPGAVGTGLVEKDPNYPAFLRFMYRLSKPFMKSPKKGASTSIYLASSPDLDGVTGKYFVNKKQAESSVESHDADLARRLWEVSLELTGVTNQRHPPTDTA